MAERTLRGARLGGQSFEDERGIEFAARQQVEYRCPQGHNFEITMADDAEVPLMWECPRCGLEAQNVHLAPAPAKVEKPARTHWDMLLERRSVKELEDILKERIELLRDGEIGPAHLHRRVQRPAASKVKAVESKASTVKTAKKEPAKPVKTVKSATTTAAVTYGQIWETP